MKYKINKDLFINNKNIVFSHFKMNWKLILFFTLIIFFISLLISSSSFINYNFGPNNQFKTKLPVIALSTQGYYPSGSSTSSVSTPLFSISNILNNVLFSRWGIVIFSLISLRFIRIVFFDDFNSKKISFWVTLPLSRNEIISFKYLFIIFTMFTIFVPTYILIIFLSSFSLDASKYIGDVILYGFNFFAFVVLVSSIYTLVAIPLIQHPVIAYIILFFIIFWIRISGTITSEYNLDPIHNSSLKYVQYFSLESLFINPLHFSLTEIGKPIILWTDPQGGQMKLESNKYLNFDKIKLSIFTIIMIFIPVIITFINNYIFRKKDLNI